ncbi:RNA polymerase sigma factor [Candidatus Woesearchaeota archaeon]|nr:RNA polymerase sigma factor [Candidatus Woesearchaeota archaeon]
MIDDAVQADNPVVRLLVEDMGNGRQFYDAMVVYARRIVGHYAEDVVCSAIEKAMINGHQCIDSPKGWFASAVRTVAIDYRRHKGSGMYAENVWHLEVDYQQDGRDLLQKLCDDEVRREREEIVQDVVNRIDFPHRAAIVLSEFYGMSYREISEILEIIEGTAWSRVHNAKRKLAEELIKTGSMDRLRWLGS